jgi:hypothetical protein
MGRKRKDKVSEIELKQPDRSGPTDATLLQLAQDRGLFDLAKQKQDANKQDAKKKLSVTAETEDDGPGLPPVAERILETLLWTVSLAMLHFTLDVLVQHQYAVDISWWKIVQRAAQALLGE